MAIEQILRQEIKQIKSAMRNGVKRSKISLAGNDDKKYQISQVNYFGIKTKNTHIINPYGLASNPSENEEGLMFNIMGQEENTAIIPYAVKSRFKGLQKGEVRVGNPLSSASVLFRNDGVASINGSEFEGIPKIVELTTKLNNLVTEHNTHTHTGVQTGAGVSGFPSTPATSFSKSDYENTNVVHGQDGTGTSGGSSGAPTASLEWGNITGTLSNQTDLKSALDAKLSTISGQPHSSLAQLDFASSGHTGFEKSLTFSTGLTRTGDTITTNDSQINHDNLLNFVAGEHFLQSAITQISNSVSDGILTTSSGVLGSITDNSTNWNTAYSWGNHAGLYDPIGTASGLIYTHESTYDHSLIATALQNIVKDTTPQLGGDLDTNSNDIKFLDNDKAIFGTGLDAEIFVDSNDDLRIKNVTQDKDIDLNVNIGSVDTTALCIKGSNGYVGIGKAAELCNPQQQLHISKEGSNGGIWFQVHSNGDHKGIFNFNRARGTITSPLAVQSGDNFGSFRFNGHDGTAIGAGPELHARASENWSVGNHGAYFNLLTIPNGGTVATSRLQIREDGEAWFMENNLNFVGNITHDDATASDWIFRNSDQDKDTIFYVNKGGVDTEAVRILGSNAYVGINQSSPIAPIHIYTDQGLVDGLLRLETEGNAGVFVNEIYSDTDTNAPGINFKRSRGTIASSTAIQSGDAIGEFRFFGHDGTTTRRQLDFGVRAAENWTATNRGVTFFVRGTNVASSTRTDWFTYEDGMMSLIQTAGCSNCATIKYEEKDTTPSNPADGTEVKMYMKDDKIIFQYNDAGTIRYKYLDLTGTGVTWQHTTTAP